MKKLFGKFEFIFLMLFFFCIIAWAMSQCQAKSKELLAGKNGGEEPTAITPPPTTTPTAIDTPLARITPPPSMQKAPKRATKTENKPILYVTLKGLKIRTKPNLSGEVVSTLDLHDKVYFLEKQSEQRDTFRLETGESASGPWLQIRTKSGKEGWAWGAGLHYYKMDRLKQE